MKIVHVETLISCGRFANSDEWAVIKKSIHKAVRAVDWPPGSGRFIIHPQSGKKRGEGNGVKPIKSGLMAELEKQSWKLEAHLDIATSSRPGKLDAVLKTDAGPIAIEWETGNISSSHRALNKMALGLLKRVLIAGVLVVPTRKLYQYLTDRIGNWNELAPYLDLWRSIPCKRGVLEIIVVEHDGISKSVPKIPKGTDGRSRD
jgi:hypothetical protein